MNTYPFELCGAGLEARAQGTLWWPERRLLVVSDMHLGKAERIARRRGPLLPPYEIAETVARLRAEVEAVHPEIVVALGDSFDDLESAAAMPETAVDELMAMAAGRRWIWITGNHDPGPVDLPGDHLAELVLGPLVFRHIADTQAQGEVSGHYHPKARLGGRARPAFLIDRDRVILPAFGTYTGGLSCDHTVLADLMAPEAIAVLTGTKAMAIPMASQLRRA